MHPVLAPSVIQVLEQNRLQLLADAERRWLIETAANASGDRRRPMVALRRVQDGFARAIAAASPFRGPRSASVGDESVAIWSA